MAYQDPSVIPLTSMQSALSRVTAFPQRKRGALPNNSQGSLSKNPAPVGKGGPGSWQRQAERQPSVGGEIRTDRKDPFNRIENFKQSEEQIKEIHKLINILITAFHSCEVVISFMNEVDGDNSFKEKLDEITNLAKNIKPDLKRKDGLTLEEVLAVQRVIRQLALDIELITMTNEISPSTVEAQNFYKKNLQDTLSFANEHEITGTREIPASQTQENTPLIRAAGIKVLRPIETQQPSRSNTLATTSTPPVAPTAQIKSPEEIAAEKLAEEKERNKKMFERAKGGEEITLEILKNAGYGEVVATNFLKILKLASQRVSV